MTTLGILVDKKRRTFHTDKIASSSESELLMALERIAVYSKGKAYGLTATRMCPIF